MTSSRGELERIRDALWSEAGRAELAAQVCEARLRLGWVFGDLLRQCFDESRLDQLIAGCLRGMGPRTLDPREWAERFVAHGWITAPREAALWRRLEAAIPPLSPNA